MAHQGELSALLKQEGNHKLPRYTPQAITIHCDTNFARSFGPQRSPSPFPRKRATSKPFKEQRRSPLSRRVNISGQIPSPLNEEIPGKKRQ
ncbi:hypothetical protein O181_016979 [Austropuccinia psidii MF-1]|uniref:Uncharacterized protein n=1 Tax=Austropuccinia psidii MF-1 TaxID=1389203 RepID=A0A9Q3GSC1_9BASI|nr:hypothetical protein [Austropuccinia psidii MF-1]